MSSSLEQDNTPISLGTPQIYYGEMQVGYAVVGTTQIVPARIPVLEDVVRWARTKS